VRPSIQESTEGLNWDQASVYSKIFSRQVEAPPAACLWRSPLNVAEIPCEVDVSVLAIVLFKRKTAIYTAKELLWYANCQTTMESAGRLGAKEKLAPGKV